MLKKQGGEDEVEELVDRPRTTSGTLFATLQSILLSFLVRCGFLTAGPVVSIPMISSQIFPSDRTAGVSSRSITVTNTIVPEMITVTNRK